MGAVVHVPVEGSAVSPALGVSTDRLSVLNRKVVINPEVVANLVDKDLEIRGYYRSSDDEALAQLVKDAKNLD